MGVKWCVCGGGGGGRCVSDYMIGHLPHLMSIFIHRTPSNGKKDLVALLLFVLLALSTGHRALYGACGF